MEIRDSIERNLMSDRKIIFFISEDWYFWSHRLPLARAMRDRGWTVVIVTRVSEYAEAIRAEGFQLQSLRFFRRNIQSPWLEIASFLEILYIYLVHTPRIVHQVALKPAIYGTLAARIARVPVIVNTLAGLGTLFTSTRTSILLLKRVVLVSMRILFRTYRVYMIVQNIEDRASILQERLVPSSRVALIRGSGVDLQQFAFHPEPGGKPTVIMLAARMLWPKGVREFVEAAKVIQNLKGADEVRFVLVGAPDPENPTSIPEEQLLAWRRAGIVEWWGYQTDMARVLAQSHIVCLPSYYREGLPKVLLEAAAVGRPLVATNTVGCREVVRSGINGFLVPSQDVDALVEALLQLIETPDLRRKMGCRGRSMVKEEFSQDIIVQRTLDLYQRALEEHGYAW